MITKTCSPIPYSRKEKPSRGLAWNHDLVGMKAIPLRGRRLSMPPRRWKRFFGDFRGSEMAAGVQAAGTSDDLETERAYLNMEAR